MQDQAQPYVLNSILFNADVVVGDRVARAIPHIGTVDRLGSYVALGVVRDDRLVGGVDFHNYRQHDIEISITFDQTGLRTWCRPEVLAGLFSYPFNTLGCARITAIAGRKNKKSRQLIENIGFKLEGTARRALDGREDAMIYGMLREECRYLQKA
jgi:RimJ/RimL family protein N-acetyltransferase